MPLSTPLLDELFRPRWAGGWAVSRVCFALAAIDAQIGRFPHIRDALAAPSMVFNAGPAHLSDHVLLAPAVAWSVWGAGFLGLVALLRGGRVAKPGLWLWVLSYAAVVAGCGLNVRVPERFIFWAVLALSIAPIGEPGLLRKDASPFARYGLLVVFGSLYLSTGLMKSLEEPAWWSGTALAYDLVDRWHAGGPLAVFLSAHPTLVWLASLYTLVFEVGFVFAILWPRWSRWVLLMGMGMHLGIGSLMEIGPLGAMVLAFYPVLLNPDDARRLWRMLARRFPARFGG